MREAVREQPRWSGQDHDAQVVNVPVRFTDEDASFTWWGYLLARHSDDEPWRIVDQGVG